MERARADSDEGVAEDREYVELMVADESCLERIGYGVGAREELGEDVEAGGEGDELRGHLKAFSGLENHCFGQPQL